MLSQEHCNKHRMLLIVVVGPGNRQFLDFGPASSNVLPFTFRILSEIVFLRLQSSRIKNQLHSGVRLCLHLDPNAQSLCLGIGRIAIVYEPQQICLMSEPSELKVPLIAPVLALPPLGLLLMGWSYDHAS